MGRSVLCGVDVGTTAVKVLLMTPTGHVVSVGRAPTPWARTPHGVQTTPAALTEAVRSALRSAVTAAPDAEVAAVGVASMAESGVLTDDDDHPLGPVIAWHDTRDEAEFAELTSELGESFSRRTGLPLWQQWSLTKYRWLRRHEPDITRAVRRYNVAEWITRDLGGRPVTEYSLASRTGWLDLHSGAPYDDGLAWAGAPASLIGELVTAGSPVGRVATTGALPQLDGAVLTVAGHDHQVAAVGLGAHHPGDEFDSAGTAEALLRTSIPGLDAESVLSLTRAGITVGRHAAPDRWCLLGATQGGLILSTVLDRLGLTRAGLGALDQAAQAAPDRPDAVTLGPGEADVTIASDADPAEIWRAATRAVTAQAGQLGRHLAEAAGPHRDLVVAGGWTHSTALMKAKRELWADLRVAADVEAGCRGAALLAGVAAGVFSDLDSASRNAPLP